MVEPLAVQQKEQAFRKFMRRLLAAQRYEFLDEARLFSPETLHKILGEFCDIVAEELSVESCTVHLQMYDPTILEDPASPAHPYLAQRRDERLRQVAACHGFPRGGRPDEVRVFEGIRHQLMESPLTFPYWQFPKGAARLVAANRGGRWEALLSHDPHGLGIVELERGITADIVQDNEAKIRDRLSIRQTRGKRKLGAADPYVWTNRDVTRRLPGDRTQAQPQDSWPPKYAFRNYYGAPIRIHSGGQVIGVLKVENSNSFGKQEIQPKLSAILHTDLRTNATQDELVPQILHASILASPALRNWIPGTALRGRRRATEHPLPINGLTGELGISLLALAYLALDVGLLVPTERTLADVVLVPYPQTPLDIEFSCESDVVDALGDGHKRLHDDQRRRLHLSTLTASEASSRLRLRVLDIHGRDQDGFTADNAVRCLFSEAVTEDAPEKVAAQCHTLCESVIGQIEDERGDRLGAYAKARPARRTERPPVQAFVDTLAAERELWRLLLTEEGPTPSIEALFARVQCCYLEMNEAVAGSDGRYRASDMREALAGVLAEHTGQAVGVKSFAEADLPDFCFQLEFRGIQVNDEALRLYVLVPPTVAELEAEATEPALFGSVVKASLYKTLNRYWRGGPDAMLRWDPPSPSSYAGEVVRWKGQGRDQTAVDLLVDRLAARVHALVHSLPVAEFTDEDTRKLCWAALEIGNLIEREISYRANRADDPMPLTAMEFDRIPISDLSFVDDLRHRREDAIRIKNNIDHYVQNAIHLMGMQDTVRYESRVKEYRSYLARIGERCEGRLRGSIATWLYLLSLLLRGKRTPYEGFTGPLDTFRQTVEDAVKRLPGKPAPDRSLPTARDLSAIRRFVSSYIRPRANNRILGDLRFDTPLLHIAPGPRGAARETRREALARITHNLECEGLLETRETRSGGRLKVASLPVPSGKLAKPRILPRYVECKDVEDLVFRQYDCFAIAAGSLFVQLANLAYPPGTSADQFRVSYREFYQACIRLRRFLSRSPREVEENPQLAVLEDVFGSEAEATGSTWQRLLSFIEATDTDQLCDRLGPKIDAGTQAAFLNIRGIYKRARTLHNTLRHQRPAAYLDWELGRFDLLGCRAACLFKNQVFAVYEELWRLGDPFFCHPAARDGRAGDGHGHDPLRERQRWLCLRTNVMEHEAYYALHLAALADPEAIDPDFWGRDHGYNLRRAQRLLERLFLRFDRPAAEQYDAFHHARRNLMNQYVEWYDIAARIGGAEPRRTDTGKARATWFGAFLGESPVDFTIWLLERYQRADATIDAKEVLGTLRLVASSLRAVLNAGKAYTAKAMASLGTARASDHESALEPLRKRKGSVRLLYARVFRSLSHLSDLYERELRSEQLPAQDPMHYLYHHLHHEDKRALGEWVRNLQEEAGYFQGVLRDHPSVRPAAPLIHVPGHDPDTDELIEALASLSRPSSPPAAQLVLVLDRLYDQLVRLRSNQKAYLFYRGSPHGKPDWPGLHLRGREEVLHRIQQYALLFSPALDAATHTVQPATKAGQPKPPSPTHGNWTEGDVQGIRGWTSYDLFYYLRSLVPVEIQVRTELANTMAEQYHSPVYKGHPPTGTEFARRRMEAVGEELNRQDDEMEIDYEDYITKYRLSNQRKQPK